MAVILQMIFNIFFNESGSILVLIARKIFPNAPIICNATLAQ